MPRFKNSNIDRSVDKPDIRNTESVRDDQNFDRSTQIRRDDDLIKTPKRTVYNIDYAIKTFIENTIQPKITGAGNELINVPVIYSNAEKWDSVRRLGYLRDEKGMLQSPLIILKRNSIQEREQLKKLDVNKFISGNSIVYQQQYNARNQYGDKIFPLSATPKENSKELYTINIPEYVDVEYDLLMWTDFTTQMNELIEQLLPYGGFAWGNESNKYRTHIRTLNFETVNTVGNDRLVRCTAPLTVNGTLLGEQEYRQSTLQKKYSLKQLTWDIVVDVNEIFSTPNFKSIAPQLPVNSQLVKITTKGGGSPIIISPELMEYITKIREVVGTAQNTNTVIANDTAGTNPSTSAAATKAEFDIYVNGQYVDKALYTWTPTLTSTQTIVFNTLTMGYDLDTEDIIIINGRWSLI